MLYVCTCMKEAKDLQSLSHDEIFFYSGRVEIYDAFLLAVMEIVYLPEEVGKFINLKLREFNIFCGFEYESC